MPQVTCFETLNRQAMALNHGYANSFKKDRYFQKYVKYTNVSSINNNNYQQKCSGLTFPNFLMLFLSYLHSDIDFLNMFSFYQNQTFEKIRMPSQEFKCSVVLKKSNSLHGENLRGINKGYCTCWASQVTLVIKNPPANARNRDVSSISGLGRSRLRKWQPTPVFLPGKFCGQRSLLGYSSWCRRFEHE